MSKNYVGRSPGQPAPDTGPVPTAGRLVQSRSHVRIDYVAQTGPAISISDAVPQNTIGTEYLSVADYTPTVLDARIRVRVHFNYTVTGVLGVMAALFRSDNSGARACGVFITGGTDYEGQILFEHEWIVDTLTPLTWSVRAGGSTSTAVRMNGRASGRIYGGAWQSFLRIDEFAP
ncbi:MAG TPA: hypothetical protein VJ755_11780 [Gemmatimonadales bacterium]|nr:hypothetical protein [Gemmatimonadales bacterium]